MAHAVVIEVQLNDEEATGMQLLNERIIPHVKELPGFQSGTWMATDENVGMGVVIFDSEDHARAAESDVQPPPGGPTLITSRIFRINATA
jgi:hypothetical protein